MLFYIVVTYKRFIVFWMLVVVFLASLFLGGSITYFKYSRLNGNNWYYKFGRDFSMSLVRFFDPKFTKISPFPRVVGIEVEKIGENEIKSVISVYVKIISIYSSKEGKSVVIADTLSGERLKFNWVRKSVFFSRRYIKNRSMEWKNLAITKLAPGDYLYLGWIANGDLSSVANSPFSPFKLKDMGDPNGVYILTVFNLPRETWSGN